MEQFLRNWRQDALNKGQHDAAVYIGDKVLALTDDDGDAFFLAQVHFNNNNYTRALAVLSRQGLIEASPACRYLVALCYIKRNKYDQALSILGDINPTHLIASAGNARRKLQHLNGTSTRHVTLRNGKSAHRSDRIDRSEEREREDASNIKYEAAMCYLRGLCFAKQNAFDRARDCYKDAVRIDVQCFEAFDQLMKNSLMSPAEELEFLESLDFDSIDSGDPSTSQEAAHFTKMLYTTRLSKYASPVALSHATETLSTHYKLTHNPDLLLSRAETLYTQCRFPEALDITSAILNSPSTSLSDPATNAHLGHNPAIYPLHLACLYETSQTNTLFLLAHTLADHAPDQPYTYLAIGVYYLAIAKIAEARRFFSKASLMDPHSAPAWIGFAHTFAAEGEHDQAIAAYSTAARLFQGSHLPQLFLGMQHLALNNMSLAHEYLSAAHAMSSGSIKRVEGSSAPPDPLQGPGGDPLVLNELGVILYHQNQLPISIQLFRQSLSLAAQLSSSPTAWLATRANLAHALRRLGQLDEALEEFDECLRISSSGSSGAGGGIFGTSGGSAAVSGYEDRNLIGSIHTSRGLVLLTLSRAREAVLALHEAVRVLGGDASGGGIAGTLLSRAVEIWALEHAGEDGGQGAGSVGVVGGKDTKGIGNGKSKGWEMGRGDTEEESIEMGLDGEAEILLNKAMRRPSPLDGKAFWAASPQAQGQSVRDADGSMAMSDDDM